MIPDFKKILLLCFILFTCCKNGPDNNTKVDDNYSLVPLEEHTFVIDSMTSYKSYFYDAMYIGEKECFGFVNRGDNSIKIWDLGSKSMLKNISLPKEGTGAVVGLSGFIFISPDSIFVFGEYGRDVQLINMDGELKKKYNFTSHDDEPLYGFGRIFSHTMVKPILFGDKIFLYGFTKPDLQNPSALFTDSKLEIELDLKTEKYQYLDIKYPEMYHHNNYHYRVTRDFDHRTEQFVHSFGADKNIWATRYGSFKKQKYEAGSEFFEEIHPQKPQDNDRVYEIESPQYQAIVYDKYREVYYRFVYQGTPYMNDKNETSTFDDSHYSIIVLDKDFRKIGETLLEKHVFVPDFFILGSGLYLSHANTKNPNLDEDKKVFTRFELRKTVDKTPFLSSPDLYLAALPPW